LKPTRKVRLRKTWLIFLQFFIIQTFISPVAFPCIDLNLLRLSHIAQDYRNRFTEDAPFEHVELFDRLKHEALSVIRKGHDLNPNQQIAFQKLTYNFLREFERTENGDYISLHWDQIIGYVRYSQDPLRGMLTLITGLRLLKRYSRLMPVEGKGVGRVEKYIKAPLTIMSLLESALWVKDQLTDFENQGVDIDNLERRLFQFWVPSFGSVDNSFKRSWKRFRKHLRMTAQSAYRAALTYQKGENPHLHSPENHSQLGTQRTHEIFGYMILSSLGFTGQQLAQFNAGINHEKAKRLLRSISDPPLDPTITNEMKTLFERFNPKQEIPLDFSDLHPKRDGKPSAIKRFFKPKGKTHLITEEFDFPQRQEDQALLGYTLGMGGGTWHDFKDMALNRAKQRTYDRTSLDKPWLTTFFLRSFIYAVQRKFQKGYQTDGTLHAVSYLDHFGLPARTLLGAKRIIYPVVRLMIWTSLLIPILNNITFPDEFGFTAWACIVGTYMGLELTSEMIAMARDLYMRLINPRRVILQWKDGDDLFVDWNYHRPGDARIRLTPYLRDAFKRRLLNPIFSP
jgi:hypothetical protein